MKPKQLIALVVVVAIAASAIVPAIIYFLEY